MKYKKHLTDSMRGYNTPLFLHKNTDMKYKLSIIILMVLGGCCVKTVTEKVYIYDTIKTHINIYDTIHTNVTDTIHINVNDTTFIIDSILKVVTDTNHIQINDTFTNWYQKLFKDLPQKVIPLVATTNVKQDTVEIYYSYWWLWPVQTDTLIANYLLRPLIGKGGQYYYATDTITYPNYKIRIPNVDINNYQLLYWMDYKGTKYYEQTRYDTIKIR